MSRGAQEARLPYQFDFDPKHHIIRGRFAGRITDEELKASYQEALAHGKNTRALAVVADFSKAIASEVSQAVVLELARMEPALADPKAIRVIVATLPGLFGMARVFELHGERTRPNLHVVRSQEEAWAILGVWNPKFEALAQPS